MIIYGHNNFLIKSIDAEQLGMNLDPSWNGVKFQIRQRYAHLFWIPFFPIGKLWAIKKPGSSDLFDMPDEIRNFIEQKYQGQYKTPWYSYSLLLLGLTVLGWIWMQGQISSYNSELSFEERTARKEMMIEYPTTGDYYHLKSGLGGSVYLKVNKDAGKNIEFISYYKHLFEKKASAENKFSMSSLEKFDRVENSQYSKMMINKELLKSMINKEYRSYSNTRVKIPGLGECYLSELKRRDY